MFCKCGHPEEQHLDGYCKGCNSRCKAFVADADLSKKKAIIDKKLQQASTIERKVKAEEPEPIIGDMIDEENEATPFGRKLDVSSVNSTAYSSYVSSGPSFGMIGSLIMGVVLMVLFVGIILPIVVTSLDSMKNSSASGAFSIPIILVVIPFGFITVMMFTGNRMSSMFRPKNLAMVALVILPVFYIFPNGVLVFPLTSIQNGSITFSTNVTQNSSWTTNDFVAEDGTTKAQISGGNGGNGTMSLNSTILVVGGGGGQGALTAENVFECPNGTQMQEVECDCAKKAREANSSWTCLSWCGRCM